MEIVRPRWSSATYLAYVGGLTVLLAATTALEYLSRSYGSFAYAAWALLVLVILEAFAAANRGPAPLVAGLFALASLAAFALFVVALWQWFGWLNHVSSSSAFGGFRLSVLSVELLSIWFAAGMLRIYRFPLLVLPLTATTWLFVTDVISNGGNWSAVVTLLFGLVLLAIGMTLDAGEGRPYGFWVHVVSGLTIAGALLFWWHSGHWHWALIAVTGLVFIVGSSTTGRSSWAVLGSLLLAGAAAHFITDWWRHGVPFLFGSSGEPRGWVPPLGLAVLGFLYLALGHGLSRLGRE
jgi:hypothetical protein